MNSEWKYYNFFSHLTTHLSQKQKGLLMTKRILVLKGDGIGPEVVNQALKTLDAISKKHNCEFEYVEGLIGGVAIDKFGVPLPDETLELAKKSDAVFLGAVGDWKYDTLDPAIRPEKGLLGIRKGLGLFANLRPVKIMDELVSSSPLKEDIIKGADIMIIRELTGGVYFGEPKGISVNEQGERIGFNTMSYTESEVKRIAKVAFEIAMKRSKKVCSVDKANVLDVSRFWREIVIDVAKAYPQVELTHQYVDNTAMQLVVNPRQFDVILTSNLFGDILSDEASVLSGSLGLLPSASLSEGTIGMYEPCHGSAPNFKGLDKLNPIATILSAGMMLKYGFHMEEAAKDVDKAVAEILKQGYRTEDIFKHEGETLVGTSKMGDLIAEQILEG